MKFNANTLKMNSITIIMLTVIGIVAFVGEIMAEEISTAKIMETANTTEQTAQLAIAITVGFYCLNYFINLFLGINGIKQADGKTGGKANFVVGVIMLTLNILSLISCIYFVIQGQASVHNIIRNLIFTCFLLPYVICVKKVS